MSDIVDEFRLMARSFEGSIGVYPPSCGATLVKGATEIEKLRKEVKLLKARNASLVWRLVWVMLIFAGAVCGTFWAAFLSS